MQNQQLNMLKNFLNTSTEQVIRQGLIWEAARATSALPGMRL